MTHCLRLEPVRSAVDTACYAHGFVAPRLSPRPRPPPVATTTSWRRHCTQLFTRSMLLSCSDFTEPSAAVKPAL